jgi:hypothetical protein
MKREIIRILDQIIEEWFGPTIWTPIIRIYLLIATPVWVGILVFLL